ncbi:peroxisomal membrane protein PEX14 isoform X2 [Arachis ipaensis]|uniref:Peroxisomal membrane protein PEX14 n=1 Tax=Arachis hypogaea TaxID=3818 RepID=A0A6B9V3T1_ARAHY|nr:peroxisomal membrane protein PEX14 isoform X2 [Arachis ipaensis]XP_025674891.1 peroxisomal membrane protein PEX14 isoform X2 [Arachis hypogaea]QHN75949.1 Peroxisomal membrane protein [Arachis hypogaea]
MPPQNTGAEFGKLTNVDQQDAGEDASKQSSKASVFVNTEPMREEQVQNAVKFLSHPKVRGSPVIYRRNFLEKKGLTKEEIDEAFRRVPDSQPSEQTAGANQDIQRPAQSQALQPGVSGSAGVTTLSRTSSRYSFHWSHALVAVGFLVVSGAGTAILIKKSILPRLKSWIRKIVLEEEYNQLESTDSKPTVVEEASKAAKAAAAAAVELAKANQEILTCRNEEKRYFLDAVSLLNQQMQEMKLMTNEIRRLEASSGASYSRREDYQVNQTSSKPFIVNGKRDYGLHSVTSSSQPASVEPSSAPHPKSYMEIMAMIQRGEKPSNIRDIDDSPPNPNQQPSNPRLAPRAKPWEVGQVQHNSTPVFQSQVNGKDLNSSVLDNSDNAVPRWQAKNARIREIDNGVENNGYNAASSQQPIKRTWVPPQPPPVVMSEAAEAIRRPKPLVQKEQILDDQSVHHSSDISDKVMESSELSKSEGQMEGSSTNAVLGSAEILEES